MEWADVATRVMEIAPQNNNDIQFIDYLDDPERALTLDKCVDIPEVSRIVRISLEARNSDPDVASKQGFSLEDIILGKAPRYFYQFARSSFESWRCFLPHLKDYSWNAFENVIWFSQRNAVIDIISKYDRIFSAPLLRGDDGPYYCYGGLDVNWGDVKLSKQVYDGYLTSFLEFYQLTSSKVKFNVRIKIPRFFSESGTVWKFNLSYYDVVNRKWFDSHIDLPAQIQPFAAVSYLLHGVYLKLGLLDDNCSSS